MRFLILAVQNSIVGLCFSEFDSIGLTIIGRYYLNHIGKRQPTSLIPIPSRLLPVYLDPISASLCLLSLFVALIAHSFLKNSRDHRISDGNSSIKRIPACSALYLHMLAFVCYRRD
ncbi:hypothetical protein F5B19DRAFT_452950 [Rostrohypoxylon terebratum]|nr:hypothetical protein F5B19DRAFT_452950 [Rostrohypoxylon terebratum]